MTTTASAVGPARQGMFSGLVEAAVAVVEVFAAEVQDYKVVNVFYDT